MTDKELLELAAKAVGYELEERYTKQNEFWPWIEELQTIWNPLTDDGDALRLAVKLGLDMSFNNLYDDSTMVSRDTDWMVEFHREDNDPYAATRRAIVRAAAEIGRTMK